MNVGILTARLPSRDTGGAEHQALTLALLLSETHRVEVFTRSRETPQEVASAPKCEIRRRRVVDLPGLRFLSDVVSTLILVGRHRKDVDVLIAYQAFVDGFLAALTRLCYGIPFIVSVRAEKEYRFERHLRSRIFSPFVFRLASVIAVQTERVKSELLSALNEAGYSSLSVAVAPKIRIVPNGIAPSEPSPGGDAVLFVGRLVEAKGVRYLIDAMKDCPGERLVIVGDGPERSRLEAAASGMKNVTFAGRVAREDLAPHFRDSRVLVLPSLRDEGMPNAIMEAMAAGVPVIATKNAGIPDLVEDGVNGFLVEPADASAIARHIQTLSAGDALRARLGRNARDRMRRFEWPRILETVEGVLREAVSSA